MAPASAERRTGGGAQTTERILDAAERRFAEDGYRGTALRDIADDVGIRAPSLYNHFASKEALYAAVLERAFGPMLEVLEAALAERAKGLADGSPRLADDMMRILAERPNRARLLLHEALAGGRHMNEILSAWIERLFGHGLRALESTPGTQPWTREELPLLLLAMNNVIAGYVALAPAFDGTLVHDPLAPAALKRQARFVGKLWDLLWGELVEAGSPPKRMGGTS